MRYSPQESNAISYRLPLATPQTRLDKLLVEMSPHHSRTYIQTLIRQGHARIDGTITKDIDYRVKQEQTVTLYFPPEPQRILKAQPLPFTIVFEDEFLLVVDKPAGLTIHIGAGHSEYTLVNGLLAHCGDRLACVGDPLRPGIVHRLDKDTSGLLVIAKTDAVHEGLAKQFSDRTICRSYQAVVWGVPIPTRNVISAALGRHPRVYRKRAVLAGGGKSAQTSYQVERTFGMTASVVRCCLTTGRTHQIRVHMAYVGHPLIGDSLYGRSRTHNQNAITKKLMAFPRQALHAESLGFIHPHYGKTLFFTSLLPSDMCELISDLTHL